VIKKSSATPAISAMILVEKKGFGTSFPNYLKLGRGTN
jgi:hypothetical protein